jgi:hypothetical protein
MPGKYIVHHTPAPADRERHLELAGAGTGAVDAVADEPAGDRCRYLGTAVPPVVDDG